MNQFEVFVSYAWGGESEKIVNELQASLQHRGVTIILDKTNLDFTGLITDFMKKIGTGKAVVVIISDKYLKSPYCMFELMEIYRNHDFLERIFPIVMEDAAIFDAEGKAKYFKHWKTKKAELEAIIQELGFAAITMIGDDYKNYDKIVHRLGEVVNELKDINALTPEMHRESNFHQLHQALIQRLEEDSRFTRKKDTEKLLKELAAGSRQYYKELTGINGPYHHLNISEEILAGISGADSGDKPAQERLQTTVKNKEGRELQLESCLQALWGQEKPHMLLLGDGGMGKTVSLIHFWETLLKTNKNAVPLFITLHEYNTVSQQEREGFITKRIVWHYLGLKENRGELINTLWELFKIVPEGEMSNIVLLLDGFNEVTVDSSEKGQLLTELEELRKKGNGVQILLSSRYEMNFTWAEGFQTLELQPLNEAKIKAYLEVQKISYPEDLKLQQILQNPMMLTLYGNSSEIIERYKGNKQFDFKPRTTTQGELLWNFLEAQVVKLANIYGLEISAFYYYKFLLRHFLPYLGYEMELAGQFEFAEEELSKIINEACRYFYRRKFIEAWPEYRAYLKDFSLKELDFAEEAERFEKMSRAICSDLRLIKRSKKVYEFLHQNFRDYFAAVHILNELERGPQDKKISSILTLRPLPIYIRRFVGQIAGESYQTEISPPPPTILMQTLDNLRGIFDEEKTGYAVWNIVNTWKDTRSHLGGADFSWLNLRQTGIQDTFCYQRHGSFYKSASFDESLISINCFLPQGHSSFVHSVASHPDGKTFISGSSDNTIKAWDLQTGECLATFQGHSDNVTSVVFHPGGKAFISGSGDSTIKAWDLQTGECLATFQGHSHYVSSVAFHPGGKIFISGSRDNTIKAWDLQTGECLATFPGHSDSVRSVAFHPGGKTFISGSGDSTIKAWDLQTGECLATFQGHSSWVNSVAFHPGGKTFISGSSDKTIKAWDLQTGECLATFQGHSDNVTSVAFHPGGKTFISGSSDNTIKAWDLQTGECLATFQGHSSSVRSVVFHPGGKTFISGSSDNTIKAWDLQTGECLATFQGHSISVTSVAFHPGGKTFISGSDDKTIKAWDLQTGECLATFQGHSSLVYSVAFHPGGKTFISGSWDNTIKAWDLQTGECLAIFQGHSSSVHSIAFHPGGKTFISGSWDNTIKAWDLQTGECLATFQGHSSYVFSVAFHPDGKTFISGSGDNTIKAWDLQTGECLATFQRHSSLVYSVAFHPGGKTFISGSWDNTIKAWDLQTGECLATFQGHSSLVHSVAFHPGGKTFISGSWDNTIKAWDLQTGECLTTIKNIGGLLVAGCSFLNLHPASELSAEAKNIMRQYGAIFDEEDEKRWNEAIHAFD